MDLPLLSRAPTSPPRTTAGSEPGRRTEGAPVYKQPAGGNRLLNGAEMTDEPPIIISEDAERARLAPEMISCASLRAADLILDPIGGKGFGRSCVIWQQSTIREAKGQPSYTRIPFSQWRRRRISKGLERRS